MKIKTFSKQILGRVTLFKGLKEDIWIQSVTLSHNFQPQRISLYTPKHESEKKTVSWCYCEPPIYIDLKNINNS